MPRTIALTSLLTLALAVVLTTTVQAQADLPHPRLVDVELGPSAPLTAVLEAGLDVIEVHGSSRVRILEWPGDEAALARLGARVTLIDADPGRTAAERAAADLA